jgi:hypothetical protein
VRVSILWRTQEWLAFGELTSAWAAELFVAVPELRRLFLGDIFAGRLDDAGPAWLVIRPGGPNESVTSADLNGFVAEHENSGWVAVETSRLPPIGDGIGLLTFDRARELRDMFGAADIETYLWYRLIVSRAMTLAFVRRRQLRPPSWWAPHGPDRANSSDERAAPTETATAPPATPPGIRTNRAERAEEACEDYLSGLNERPKNKEAAFEAAVAACAKFGPLSRNAFVRAWAKNARAEWKRAGRRKGP